MSQTLDRLRLFPNQYVDGSNPYGIPLDDPMPAKTVLDPAYYSSWPIRESDCAQLIRQLLYHLRSNFVAMIALEGRDCDTLSDEHLHDIANTMSFAGASGTAAERLALAYDFCKSLRTHLRFDDVQAVVQTPDRRLDGKTPLEALATCSVAKARRMLQPIMMAHIIRGVSNAALALDSQTRQPRTVE
jgi:hypothetical protein